MWRDYTLNEKPLEFMIHVVSLGDCPTATTAHLPLRKTADLAGEEYNEEKKIIHNSTYMDDIIDSVKGKYWAKHRLNNNGRFCWKTFFGTKTWIYLCSERRV